MVTAAYFDWDERLFAKRNKEYGAYILRKNYVQRTLRALLIGISLVVIGVAFPFVKASVFAIHAEEDAATFTRGVRRNGNHHDVLRWKGRVCDRRGHLHL